MPPTLLAHPVRPDPAASRPTRRRFLSAFRRDEDGSILIFSLFMFVLMLMVAGISLDIERFETARTKVQATADGAALAAASLTQDVAAAELVRDYFLKAGMETFLEGIEVESDINLSEVTVNADINVPTHFFNMIGIENLATEIRATAAESIDNVEIALVLDVSGSMAQNRKIENLIDAAELFVDAIYANAAPDSISISVVPYSTQVSAGPDVLTHFGAPTLVHSHSWCLDFAEAEFDTVALDLVSGYAQSTHMDARHGRRGWRPGDGLSYNECSTRGWTDMLVMSQDTRELKSYFRRFRPTDWTSIEVGVKWGAALLDPSFGEVVDGMVADGAVDAAFADRPAAMDSSDTLKVMVVMTDGINTDQFVMDDPYRTGPSPIYVWHDARGRPYYSIWKHDTAPDPELRTETATRSEYRCIRRDRWGGCRERAWVTVTEEVAVSNWYVVNDYGVRGLSAGWAGTPLGAEEARQMTWDEVWADIPVRVVVDDWLVDMGSEVAALRNAIDTAYTYVDRAEKDPRTRAICSAAKNAGILLYTISFEAPLPSRRLLADCATTASHAFDVDGTEIGQAFAAIAADVSRLRLTR